MVAAQKDEVDENKRVCVKELAFVLCMFANTWCWILSSCSSKCVMALVCSWRLLSLVQWRRGARGGRDLGDTESYGGQGPGGCREVWGAETWGGAGSYGAQGPGGAQGARGGRDLGGHRELWGAGTWGGRRELEEGGPGWWGAVPAGRAAPHCCLSGPGCFTLCLPFKATLLAWRKVNSRRLTQACLFTQRERFVYLPQAQRLSVSCVDS